MIPSVSVGIPTYQQPELAVRAVSSTLDQQGCDLEVLVTDDSRDDTVRDALRRFASDPRFRYIRNRSRLGPAANWNESLLLGRQPIRKILHHDDWFSDELALRRLVEPIARGETPVAFSACNACRGDGSIQFVHRASQSQIEDLRRNPAAILFGNFIGAPSTLALHANVQTRFNPNYTWVADMEFYSRLFAEVGGKFAFIDTPLINISIDLPSQLTRPFEENGGLALYEYASMFAGAVLLPEDRRRARAFVDNFQAGLTPYARRSALLSAIRRRHIRVIVGLLGSHVRGRRMSKPVHGAA